MTTAVSTDARRAQSAGHFKFLLRQVEAAVALADRERAQRFLQVLPSISLPLAPASVSHVRSPP